jgi:hypothetical protein
MRSRSDWEAACAALGSFFGLPPYVFQNVAAASQRSRVPSLLDDALRILGR